jgi:hypothetical protein
LKLRASSRLSSENSEDSSSEKSTRYDYTDTSLIFIYFLNEFDSLTVCFENFFDYSLAIEGFWEEKGDYYSSNLIGPRFGEV